MEHKYKQPTRPFFARQGGKTKLSKFIVSKLPTGYENMIYVEPFVGGGSIFFRKKTSKKEVINDLDKDIYNMFIDMKSVGDKIQHMDFNNISRSEFNRLKNKKSFNNKKARLYRNLILSKWSFSGTRKTYIGEKSASSYRFTKVGAFIKKRALDYKMRLKDVKIHKQDFSTIIKKYDSPNTIFYLDPPYSYSYKDYSNWVSPVKVYNTLKNIKGKFLLSYDNSKDVKDLFHNYKIIKVNTIYEVSGKRQSVKEILIKNF